MNGLSNSVDEVVECPLCMEPLEVDDLNFYPCTCGYQICRFCWHRIRTDENELCPACRKEYPENPADFTPLTQEEMIAFKSQKRQRDQQRKQKITENRKHLANVRVVQKNLVFVVGLPPRLADADILKKHEYFGKFGKIHKVVINPSTTYAGVQGPSASAYVTYVHNSDALRAIQSVNNIMIDGRLIKTSLGTTKYCSHFMKNQQCPKGDCMYLHELGDPEASFTKEEMHQGKHQEYEKRLHDALIATSGTNTTSGIGQATTNTNAPVSVGGGSVTTASGKSNDGSKPLNGNVSSSSVMSSSSSSSSSSSTSSGAATTAAVATGAQQKEAWPSLSVSPVNSKEPVSGSNGKNKKEKAKPEKPRNDKKSKANSNRSNSNNNNSSSTTKENNQQQHVQNYGTKGIASESSSTNLESDSNSGSKSRVERNKEKIQEKSLSVRNNKELQAQKSEENHDISVDEEINLFNGLDKMSENSSQEVDNLTTIRSNSNHFNIEDSDRKILKREDQRSLSSNSSSSSSNSSGSTSTLSESTSGKSSPDGFVDAGLCTEKLRSSSNEKENQSESAFDGSDSSGRCENLDLQQSLTNAVNKGEVVTLPVADSSDSSNSSLFTEIDSKSSTSGLLPTSNSITELQSNNSASSNNMVDTTATLSKLNLFDDNNSFFSSSSMASLQQSLLLKSKLGSELRQNPMSNIPSHLPDLLNGVDGFQSNTTSSNDWEEAFKNAVMRSSKQMEDQLQHQQMHQPPQQLHHHQLQHQQDEFLRAQEMQKRNSLLNNIGLSPLSGPHNDFLNISNNFSNSTDLNRLSQAALLQQQQQQLLQLQQTSHPSEHVMDNTLFGTNMSKFFDFHKNQQQQQQHIHQQFMMNGHCGGGNGLSTDHLRMASLLENNRINSHFVDQPSSSILTAQQQQQLQKHRLMGKCDLGVNILHQHFQKLDININSLPRNQQQPVTQNQQTQQKAKQQQSQNQQLLSGTQQQAQSRVPSQFTQNASVDDDLGFDPFIETQKALAELMENEMAQQQSTNVAISNNTTTAAMKILEHQQQQQQQQIAQQHQQPLLDNMQRARMPPPGFNHMNAFGFGVPRAQNTSNILPFMNIGNNLASNSGQGTNQQMQMSSSWNPHMTSFQQQQQQHQTLGDPQMLQLNQNQNGGSRNKGYNNNDWTAMDPAILSFRQFSFPQQPQMVHHPQQQDIFVQHMSQQQQQNNPGFGSQSQHHGGITLPNALLNPQQNSQAQMNFSQSNWLSNEQSLFMNSLGNGFANNSFDKFSIPTPPGIHPSNLNKQKKAECIN